jgi:(2R)-3-sulfolactate dehydrogenase (NADP+)
MRVTFAAATTLGADLLATTGMPEDRARRTAWALAAADAWGRGSHGMLRLPFYLARLNDGGADPRASLTTVADRGATLALDGGNGLGHWQVWEAAEQATSRAQRSGLAAVSVGNSGHCGALGLYLLPAVDAGLIGMVFSHGPAVIPPWGGSSPVTSTSPLALGFPVEPRPVIVDLACSAVARGKIAEAASAGHELPEGWALDRAGRPTTDPAAALQGMLAPLGGAKGFALALAVEALTAGMVGPNLSTGVADPLDPARTAEAQRIAHLVMVLDPAAFDIDGQAPARLEALGRSVLQAGGRLPGAAHPLPGEIVDDTEVTVPDRVADRLAQAAAERGVELPAGWG